MFYSNKEITTHSKTLTDNFFSNILSRGAKCGITTTTVSDHLPQFLFAPNILLFEFCEKSNIFETMKTLFLTIFIKTNLKRFSFIKKM